ncbi:DNA-3-methyladenine glycosylase family protein [Kocuria sp. M1R5S2]|uniref:DNA-3-methyladenine glycosylase family protein n=1 Tax=Kocuria rhizosphaerae TaxID=3376285 RepID=UPI00379FFB59
MSTTTSPPTRPRPAGPADAELVWDPAGALHLGETLGVLGRGGGDPVLRVLAPDVVWLTARTATGPVSARFSRTGPGTPLHRPVLVRAWGPGAAEFLAEAPRWAGAEDSWERFEASEAFRALPHRLAAARHHHPGLRLPSTGRVLDRAVVSVLEQRVTVREAVAAHRRLVRRHGEPAPGPAPAGMRVPPTPEAWRRVPAWEWHRAGVDGGRAATVRRVAERAGALERLGRGPLDAGLHRALRSVPGLGPWTVAEIVQCTHGDPDSVSVLDFHLADTVCWFFDRRPGDDRRMLQLLEPWRGDRQRVVRLLRASGFRKPSFAPRLRPEDHRAR